jgi:hypothetical protein
MGVNYWPVVADDMVDLSIGGRDRGAPPGWALPSVALAAPPLVWTSPMAKARGKDAASGDCEESGAPPLLPRPVNWDWGQLLCVCVGTVAQMSSVGRLSFSHVCSGGHELGAR